MTPRDLSARLEGFDEPHRRRLRDLLQSPPWQSALASGQLEAAAADGVTPPETENVFALPVEQLVAANGAATRARIAEGERDPERLLDVLGTWPTEWPAELPVRLSFLGLNLGFDCNMVPRCAYCNQRAVPSKLGHERLAEVIAEARGKVGKGPYVYLTGGEPLLAVPGLWGPEGLIRRAADIGASCNLNTNALALTPEVALGLVRSGLGRVHVSVDTHVPEVADRLYGAPGRWQQAMTGLWNLQIAKALLGADHPVIHLNCVLTNRIADLFPGLLAFALSMKPLVEGAVSPDLDMHLIPVGGDGNRHLRLTAAEYERLFTQTWDAANAVWIDYQAERGVADTERKVLEEAVPFMSPYHRVAQRGSLRDWAREAAEGRPCALALTRRCYVAPTQAFVLPDGSQYWCGGHTTTRPAPVGNVLESTVPANMRRSLAEVRGFPGPSCGSCAGATQAINQIVEARLREQIADWIAEAESPGPAPGAGLGAGDSGPNQASSATRRVR